MEYFPLTRNHYVISTSPEGEVRLNSNRILASPWGEAEICTANFGEGRRP